MKSEEFLDEALPNLGGWWRTKAAPWLGQNLNLASQTGLLGSQAASIAKGISAKQRNDAQIKISFINQLKQRFYSNKRYGLYESFNFNSYKKFNQLLESIVVNEAATPMTTKEFLDEFLIDKLQNYIVPSSLQKQYDLLVQQFDDEYRTTKEFPQKSADDLWDWYLRVVEAQDRDPRTGAAVGGKNSGPQASTFRTPKLPTAQQWDQITAKLDYLEVPSRSTSGKWVGAPLAFTDDKTLTNYQFNFADNKWYNTSSGPTPTEVDPEDYPTLNAMFVQKFNDKMKSARARAPAPAPTPASGTP